MDFEFEFLEDYGINYREGLARCLDDWDFYLQILAMFLQDESLSKAKVAFGDKDYSRLFECLHTLKGVCGNAGMTKLYNVTSELVQMLREQKGTDREIQSLLEQANNDYDRAVQGIRLAINKKNGISD